MSNYINPTAPVVSLQRMLNALSPELPNLPKLQPDGVFGESTMEAVMIFQRSQELPVTGIVDAATWEALTKAYINLMRPSKPPQPVCLYAQVAGWAVSPGEFSLLLFPIQGMFSALSERLDGVQAAPPSGWLDQATAENLRWLQRCSSCEVCGSLNQSTWNYLRRIYETFVVRALELPPDSVS
ncbi:MAG: peptidoglycan-binding protein [Ruminiclostridium sp.]|jgi:hypothetical protein|nr:peptidoglycan-binding protein [Ruminiclostridium sp.]MCI9466600.1 peptidoglycan-binding protein [Ruminiclostridium sp.]